MELDVYNFRGPGVALAMYNVDEVRLVFNGFLLDGHLSINYNDNPCVCSLFELLLSHQ